MEQTGVQCAIERLYSAKYHYLLEESNLFTITHEQPGMPDSTDLYEEHPETFLPLFDKWAEDAEKQVDEMLARLKDAYDYSPSSVLDVGCGIGRHSIHFAKRGIEVRGLDISAEYIERAKERAASAGVGNATSFLRKDMRDIDELSETFDLVTSVTSSFGFFDEATNAALIESFRDRLNPGGVLLMEVPNKDGFLTEWTGTAVGRPTENSVHAEAHEYDPLTSRVTVTVFAVEDDTYLGEGQFETRLYAPIDLQRRFDEAGFDDIHLFAGFDGEELARESRRLLLIGRK